MAEKFDINGQLIGNGSWHMPYTVQDFGDLPINVIVEEAATTESVYVTYVCGEKKAKVRYSTHTSNGEKFGDTIVGGTRNERNEILARLGFMRRVWKPCLEKCIDAAFVSKKRINEYEVVDTEFAALLALPEGTDISELVGKVVPHGTRYMLIQGAEVKVMESRFGHYVYEEL